MSPAKACPIRDPEKNCAVVIEMEKRIRDEKADFKRIHAAYKKDKKIYRITIVVLSAILFLVLTIGPTKTGDWLKGIILNIF